jgi:hypothetical protein
MSDKLECTEANAPLFAEWIKTRGGLAVWRSINLSNPGASWTTPVRGPEGQPVGKPTWQVAEQPERVITDPDDVVVVTRREVKRFRVGVRQSGLQCKLTDAASRRVRAAVAKAGNDASYTFDYGTQEAVIEVPAGQVTLGQWLASR